MAQTTNRSLSLLITFFLSLRPLPYLSSTQPDDTCLHSPARLTVKLLYCTVIASHAQRKRTFKSCEL